MAQLKSTVVQGSLRVTDTTYTTNLNLSGVSASLSIFTDANKNLITKSAADAWTALGGGESGKHANSYFVAAKSSTTDNAIVRFDGTAGQVQNSTATIDDSGNLSILGKLNLNRVSSSAYGRISYYSPSYTTWFDYMSESGNGNAPTGGKPSTLGNVTTWAIRHLIEQSSGYGWIWESCANGAASANTVTPTPRMALSSNNGQLRIAPNFSSTANESGGLIIDGSVNGGSGNVALELWRGGNASWQIANESGILYFRDNYNTAKQTTYVDTQFSIAYNTGNATLTKGSLTMANSIYITKAGECGLEVDNTQGTNPNKVAFIVGSSGNGGIYSRKHSKWIVYADASGNVSLNGNANTATKWASAQKVYVTLGTASTTTTIQGGSTSAQTIGVDGTLGVGHGGTGITTTDAHEVLIGPSSGNAAAPTWRTIAAADLPTAATNALGIMKVGTGLGVSSGTVSVSYGTNANTALQGNAYLVKLNGLTKTAASDSMADFYAPTSVGTNGQFLKSVGSGEPTWSALPTASTTVAGIVKLGASGGAATYEHTHSEYAKIKPFSANWSSGTSIAIADSWITEGAAVVATDLQTKNLPGVVTWTITTNNITFTCTVAASSSTIGEFHFLMIKP